MCVYCVCAYIYIYILLRRIYQRVIYFDRFLMNFSMQMKFVFPFVSCQQHKETYTTYMHYTCTIYENTYYQYSESYVKYTMRVTREKLCLQFFV